MKLYSDDLITYQFTKDERAVLILGLAALQDVEAVPEETKAITKGLGIYLWTGARDDSRGYEHPDMGD